MSITVCSSVRELPDGYYLADCAISGGTLRDYLHELLRASEGRLCVSLGPVYMDFPLPCPSGVGRVLTVQELSSMRDGAPCHYSRDLCAEYFTLVRDGAAHVVLFDSLTSLRDKFRTAEACGVPMALIEDSSLRSAITGSS